MANSKVEQLLADSRLAFLNQQNDTALRLAKEAIKLEPRKYNQSQSGDGSLID